MYKLFVTNAKTGEEKAFNFDSFELACLYRDYHLAFGHWSSIAKWVSENEITDSQRKFIVEEKFIGIDKYFKVADGFEIRIQKEDRNTLEEAWMLLRKKRNKLLEETDWSQISDVELTTEKRKDYRSYRSYLRVLPKLYDDATVMHAKVYSFADWKKGKR
jgi:hypothetical protein